MTQCLRIYAHVPLLPHEMRQRPPKLPTFTARPPIFALDAVTMPKKLKGKSHFMQLAQLHLGEAYTALGLRELGEMKLAIFVHDDTAPYVRGVRQSVERTGLGGVVANKGGIVVALDIGNIQLAFASCHLAAHEVGCRLRARWTPCALEPCVRISTKLLITFLSCVCWGICGGSRPPM